VWDCKYHVVWITKYRYSVLVGDVGLRSRELLREIARSLEMTIYGLRWVSTKGRLTQSDREEWAQAHRIDVPSKLEGHLVATMSLGDCTKNTPREQKQWAKRGSWHFILNDVKLLKRPTKMPGQLGIWNVHRTKR
jgi:hypothetical protein